jgi:transposase
MPASMLYHTNQITDIQVENVEYFESKIIYHAIYQPKKSSCPSCAHSSYNLDGIKIRTLRMAPLADKAAILSLKIHRFKCCNCDRVWWPPILFVKGKRRTTISFDRFVIKMMQFATIKHVATFLGVSWGLIKNIHKAYLKEKHKGIDFEVLRYIGIDEFSIRKGHEYMTIFINLETGEIIHAVEGKSMASVSPFFLELKEKAKHLKAIAMDMNAAYASVTKIHLPDVDIVFDRFHVVALLNTVIDEIRRDQQAKCNAVGLKAIQGMRFLLLSNYEKLNPKKQSSLECLLEVNKPIAIAHAMKEQIRLFWMKSTVQEGCKFLGWWIIDAIETGICELAKAGRTFLRYWEGLTNYFKHKITNGKTEGINNKIKTMKRQAYGFRDMEYFKLRLYNLHTVNHSFV